MSDVGTNYQTTFNYNYGNYGTEGTDGTQGTKGTYFGDGAESLGGVWGMAPYLAHVNSPALQAVLYGLSDDTPGFEEDAEYTPTQAYYDSFATNLQALIDKYGLTEEQANKLVQAHFLGTPPDDEFLKGVLSELDESVKEELTQLFDLPETSDQIMALIEKVNAFRSSAQEQIQSLRNQIDDLSSQTWQNPGLKEKLEQKLRELESTLAKFDGALARANSSTDRAELAKQAEEMNSIMEELDGQMGELAELAKDDPQLYATLSALRDGINSSASDFNEVLSGIQLAYQLSQGDYSGLTSSVKNTYMQLLSSDYKSSFLEQAKSMGLSNDQIGKLQFIFNNRDYLNGFGEDIAALFEQINSATLLSMGLPPGYEPPVDTTAYTANMTDTADKIFEQVLDNYIAKNGLPPEKVSELKNIYFGLIPGELPADFLSELQSEMTSQMGLPQGFPLPKGSTYSLGVSGQFQQEFLALLNGLTPEQKAAVMQALTNPLDPNITDETRALIQELFNTAASTVRQQYGLPDTWYPEASVLKDIATMDLRFQVANQNITQIETQLELAISVVQTWPESPTKALYLNILKIVSEALSDLKKQVAIMQMVESTIAKKLSQAELDAALTKVEENLEKLNEMKEKQGKMAENKPLMEFLKVFSFMFAAILCVIAGPVGFALLGTLIAGEVDGKDYIKIAFKATFEAITKAIPGPLGEALAMIVEFVMIWAICAAGNIMLGMMVLFEHSGVIQTFFTEICNCDPMVGEIVAMALQLIYEIVLMVVLAIVTGGAGGALLVAQITAKIAQVAAKAAAMIARMLVAVVETLVSVAEKCAQMGKIMATVGKVFQKVAQIINNLILNLVKFESRLLKYADDMLVVADRMTKVMKEMKFSGKDQIKSVFKDTTGSQELDICIKIVNAEINLLQAVFNTFAISLAAVQAAGMITTVSNSIVAAELARLKGALESLMTELEAQIGAMKKFMQKLLESLEGLSAWISDISNVQTNYWAGQGQALDGLMGANQAA